MQIRIRFPAALAFLFTVTESAFAFAPINNIPEPGVLGLLVAGGIVGVVLAIRNRRK